MKIKILTLLFTTLLTITFAFAVTSLEEETGGADLSQADPNFTYYISTHIQYQDKGDLQLHDFRGRKREISQISPYIIAYSSLFWNHQVQDISSDKIFVTLESLSLDRFKVIGTTLYGEQMLLTKTWVKGTNNQPTTPESMDLIWKRDASFESDVPQEIVRMIGERKFIVTFIFLAVPQK